MERPDFDALVSAVAKGDASAYRRLLEASARLVRGYLHAKIGGALKGDIEDIVQETLLAVHLKYYSYNASMPFLPWLRTIAHHKLVDALRKRRMAQVVSLDDFMLETLPAAESAETDSALTLERYMASLNDKQQRIVKLARIDGKSMNEIAAELKLSVADVKVTLHRALRKLAHLAKEDGAHAHG